MPMMFEAKNNYILTASCTSRLGTVAAISGFLASRGCYIVEMSHPADFLTPKPRVKTQWTARRDGVEVETTWGRDDDPYDPIAQVKEATVEIKVRTNGGAVETHLDRIRMKEWTASEFDAAVRLAGAFEVAERHGDFAIDAPFDSSPRSWRMISVLKKREP